MKSLPPELKLQASLSDASTFAEELVRNLRELDERNALLENKLKIANARIEDLEAQREEVPYSYASDKLAEREARD